MNRLKRYIATLYECKYCHRSTPNFNCICDKCWERLKAGQFG